MEFKVKISPYSTAIVVHQQQSIVTQLPEHKSDLWLTSSSLVSPQLFSSLEAMNVKSKIPLKLVNDVRFVKIKELHLGTSLITGKKRFAMLHI